MYIERRRLSHINFLLRIHIFFTDICTYYSFAGKTSWLGEFKRLAYHTPLIETEVLKEHSHQVLHVSFSHNGKMFATCSKDGYILVSSSFILQLLLFLV